MPFRRIDFPFTLDGSDIQKIQSKYYTIFKALFTLEIRFMHCVILNMKHFVYNQMDSLSRWKMSASNMIFTYVKGLPEINFNYQANKEADFPAVFF